MTMKKILASGVAAVLLTACSSQSNRSEGSEAVEPGFVSLFNGRDLSGWEGATDTYCVSPEGYLTCTQRDGVGESGAKNLWTAKDYANFIIRFDVKLPPNANNGLGIRCKPNGWCSREGIEIQLLDDRGSDYTNPDGSHKLEDVHYTGSIYGVVAPKFRPDGDSYLNKPGEWNAVEVTAIGQKIKVVLNGTTIVDADISGYSDCGVNPPDAIRRPGLHNASGRLHWCGHGHNIFWRNIRIKELPATEPPKPPKTVIASSFGWNAADATKCLQAALDSGVPRVVVDKQAGEWLVSTIRVPSNVEVVFQDGVVVRAKPGTMIRTTDCLFRFRNVTNVVFRGEGKAVLRMNRKDYLNRKDIYQHGEHRHLLSLHGVRDSAVLDLTLEESGGDGVYLLGTTNVLLDNLVCRGHARQGTSLISCENVRISNCVFTETMGALPECGMDIEPGHDRFHIGKVVIDKCLFCSNNCSGVAINVSGLQEKSGTMDVTYSNCRMLDNAQRGLWTIFSRGLSAPVKGRVNFYDCEMGGNPAGPVQIANLEADGLKVTFANCRFDAAGMKRPGSPIVISNGGVKSDLNNLVFDRCELVNAPKGVAPVSFNAMTGGGVLPGGAKGVLAVKYADGTKGSFDFATLEKKFPPKPELKKFETGAVDLKKLVPANPSGKASGEQNLGIYRGAFTFLQWVPKAGSYPIRFISSPIGKKRNTNIEVEVFDPAGTPHDVFTVTEQDFTYQLKTTAKDTIYRFVVRPNGSRVRLGSENPGQGFVATSRVHWLTGAGQDLYFQAKAGAGDVKVELTMSPGEWVSAELIDPAGKVVDSCAKADAGVILSGRRAKDAPAEVWRLHVTRFFDDCKIRLGAATSGVYAYDPALLLIER